MHYLTSTALLRRRRLHKIIRPSNPGARSLLENWRRRSGHTRLALALIVWIAIASRGRGAVSEVDPTTSGIFAHGASQDGIREGGEPDCRGLVMRVYDPVINGVIGCSGDVFVDTDTTNAHGNVLKFL